MSDHVIIRRRLRSNFTHLDNAVITDKRLSWKALGLLTYLLHLPPDFRLRLKHLAAQRPTGRDATRSGLRELEVVGYLTIIVDRHPSGKFSSTTWHVTDAPGIAPESDNPYPASPAPSPSEPSKPKLTRTKTKQELSLKRQTQQIAGDLIFPNIPTKDKEKLVELINQIPEEYRQDVLDELEGKRANGKLTSGVIALARYLTSNLEKFSLADGLSIQEKRATQKNIVTTKNINEKNFETAQKSADENLLAMSVDEFEKFSASLPPGIIKRLEKRRQELESTSLPSENHDD